MSNNNNQRRTCGNCRFCRHKPIKNGVQVITGKDVHQCWAMPPSLFFLPNGKLMTLRPPVDEADLACSLWRMLSES